MGHAVSMTHYVHAIKKNKKKLDDQSVILSLALVLNHVGKTSCMINT